MNMIAYVIFVTLNGYMTLGVICMMFGCVLESGDRFSRLFLHGK